MAKALIGMKAKPSIFEYAPLPATAVEEKVLMLVCTTRFAMAMTEFWTPEGRPYFMISLRMGGQNDIFLSCTL